MAFDSTGLAGKAQNRLHDTPWCRINKETEPKKTAENTGDEADQRHAERKRKPDN